MTREEMIEALAVADTEMIYNMDDGDQWFSINDLITEKLKRMSEEELASYYALVFDEEN